MSESRAARGRPKGTGLDDRSRLLAVAELMARDPDLKATTAIKSTGVSDPSTIRRLRDKYQQIKDELIAEVGPKQARPARASAPRTAPARMASTPKKRAKPPLTKNEPAVAETVAPAAPSPAVAAPAAAIPDPAAWMAMWYGLGLQSLNNVVALQISFVEKMMRMPHVATALRGQVAFNEMTLALCPIPPSMPKTLH